MHTYGGGVSTRGPGKSRGARCQVSRPRSPGIFQLGERGGGRRRGGEVGNTLRGWRTSERIPASVMLSMAT